MQSGDDEITVVHNSVDTVNTAAAAIVTAESRTQPPAEPVSDSTPYYPMVSFLSIVTLSCMVFSR
jgi:hypothetical protein